MLIGATAHLRKRKNRMMLLKTCCPACGHVSVSTLIPLLLLTFLSLVDRATAFTVKLESERKTHQLRLSVQRGGPLQRGGFSTTKEQAAPTATAHQGSSSSRATSSPSRTNEFRRLFFQPKQATVPRPQEEDDVVDPAVAVQELEEPKAARTTSRPAVVEQGAGGPDDFDQTSVLQRTSPRVDDDIVETRSSEQITSTALLELERRTGTNSHAKQEQQQHQGSHSSKKDDAGEQISFSGEDGDEQRGGGTGDEQRGRGTGDEQQGGDGDPGSFSGGTPGSSGPGDGEAGASTPGPSPSPLPHGPSQVFAPAAPAPSPGESTRTPPLMDGNIAQQVPQGAEATTTTATSTKFPADHPFSDTDLMPLSCEKSDWTTQGENEDTDFLFGDLCAIDLTPGRNTPTEAELKEIPVDTITGHRPTEDEKTKYAKQCSDLLGKANQLRTEFETVSALDNIPVNQMEFDGPEQVFMRNYFYPVDVSSSFVANLNSGQGIVKPNNENFMWMCKFICDKMDDCNVFTYVSTQADEGKDQSNGLKYYCWPKGSTTSGPLRPQDTFYPRYGWYSSLCKTRYDPNYVRPIGGESCSNELLGRKGRMTDECVRNECVERVQQFSNGESSYTNNLAVYPVSANDPESYDHEVTRVTTCCYRDVTKPDTCPTSSTTVAPGGITMDPAAGKLKPFTPNSNLTAQGGGEAGEQNTLTEQSNTNLDSPAGLDTGCIPWWGWILIALIVVSILLWCLYHCCAKAFAQEKGVTAPPAEVDVGEEDNTTTVTDITEDTTTEPEVLPSVSYLPSKPPKISKKVKKKKKKITSAVMPAPVVLMKTASFESKGPAGLESLNVKDFEDFVEHPPPEPPQVPSLDVEPGQYPQLKPPKALEKKIKVKLPLKYKGIGTTTAFVDDIEKKKQHMYLGGARTIPGDHDGHSDMRHEVSETVLGAPVEHTRMTAAGLLSVLPKGEEFGSSRSSRKSVSGGPRSSVRTSSNIRSSSMRSKSPRSSTIKPRSRSKTPTSGAPASTRKSTAADEFKSGQQSGLQSTSGGPRSGRETYNSTGGGGEPTGAPVSEEMLLSSRESSRSSGRSSTKKSIFSSRARKAKMKANIVSAVRSGASPGSSSGLLLPPSSASNKKKRSTKSPEGQSNLLLFQSNSREAGYTSSGDQDSGISSGGDSVGSNNSRDILSE
ncbi:unnamed protein product [Amoebophrya sp. A120]|nr:unnamed protein product [Amoebophrya sp. A120]|eukprot:GSA120T00025195001.1